MAESYGMFSFCCCESVGFFDYYADVTQQPQPPGEEFDPDLFRLIKNDLMWRSATVRPEGQPFVYTSLDGPIWYVDLRPATTDVDEGHYTLTATPLDSAAELVWGSRDANESHPDADLGDVILNSREDNIRTFGPDAEEYSEPYSTFLGENRTLVRVTTDDLTGDAYVYADFTPTAGEGYYVTLNLRYMPTSEVAFLRVAIGPFDGTDSYSTLIDLANHTATPDTDVTINFVGDDDEGDETYQYRFYFFQSVSPSGACRIKITAVDSGGSTIEDANGELFYATFKVREQAAAAPGSDVLLVNAVDATLDYFYYVERDVFPAASNRHSETEGASIESIVVSTQQQTVRLNPVWEPNWDGTFYSVGPFITQEGQWFNHCITASCNHENIAFYWMDRLPQLGEVFDPMEEFDYIIVLGPGGVKKRTWGYTMHALAGSRGIREADRLGMTDSPSSDGYGAGYLTIDYCERSTKYNMPRIVGAPPSGYPNVFAIVPTPSIWKYPNDSRWFPRGWCFDGAGDAEGLWDPTNLKFLYERHTITSTCSVTYGPWARSFHPVETQSEDHNVPPEWGFPWYRDAIDEDMPFLHGATSGAVWSGSHTGDDLMHWQNGTDGTGHDEWHTIREPVMMACNVVRGDGDESIGGAIITYFKRYVELTGPGADGYYSEDYGGWYEIFLGGGNEWWYDQANGIHFPPFEAVETFRYWLVVAIAGNTLFEKEIFSDFEVPWYKLSPTTGLPLSTADHLVAGLRLIQGGRWVWFEAIDANGNLASSSEYEGPRAQWRMHVTEPEAPFAEDWYIDSMDGSGAPDVIGSSDDYFDVCGFYLCDNRMADDNTLNWKFSHDGSNIWPIRELTSTAGEDGYRHLGYDIPYGYAETNGIYYRGPVRHSSQLPHSVVPEQYPDREDVLWTDQLLAAMGGSLGGDATYEDDRLELTTADETANASVNDSFVASSRQRYRFRLTAKPDEVTKLQVVFADLHGEGIDSSAVIDLNAQTIGSLVTIHSSEVDDLGDGRALYTIYVEQAEDPPTSVNCTLKVKLVDASGTTITGTIGDGAFLYSWSLSSACRGDDINGVSLLS